MPLYEYDCDACGSFSELQQMSRAEEPMPCPDCGEASQRIMCAPFIANMDPFNRVAHQRNEKSAHEPAVTAGPPPGQKHGHAHHHGHSHRRRGLGDGLQHGHGRPWALGH